MVTKKRGKKGQSANEAALLVTFMTFFLIITLAAVSDDIIDASDSNYRQMLQDVADVIEQEAKIAFASENGYAHSFTLPQTLNGQPYEISVTSARDIGEQANTTIVSVASTRPNVQLNVTRLLPRDVIGSIVIGKNTARKEQGIVVLTFTLTPPDVQGVNPSSGPTAGGTSVSITGSDFASGAGVSFGGTAASNVEWVSSSQLTATTPAHAAGAVDVVVTNPDGQFDTLSSSFTYVPPPSVLSVVPSSGSTSGGTSVTITGSDFTATPAVTFGGVAAADVVWVNSSQLTAATPAHAAGTVDVVVTNPDGQFDTLSSSFTYVAPPPPSITRISPLIGPYTGGTAVTITGANFVNPPTVDFGSFRSASVTFNSPTNLTAISPASTTVQFVSVKVTNPDGQSATSLTQFLYRVSPVPLGAVFVTSSSYRADLGQLTGADSKCQARANAGGFGGTWKAWLSTLGTNAKDRITDTTYRRLDDSVVADSMNDLTDGLIANQISVTDDGSVISSGIVWTGTKADGTHSGNTCNSWKSADWVLDGRVGNPQATNNVWTHNYIAQCVMRARLYCFRTG